MASPKLNMLLPPYLTVEISNNCNLDCVMCTLSEKDPLVPQFMSVSLFEKTLDSIYKSSLVFSDLRLFWAGEPLMHPQFPELIAMLEKQEKHNPKFKLVTLDTNATLLYKNIADVLCKAAETLPLSLIVSIDAFQPETYGKIRRMGEFKAVMENIAAFLDRKGKNTFPKVCIQFIVMKQNCKELPDFISFWKQEFEQRNIEFNISLNSSTADKDGINIRPLTEQNRPALQQQANKLFLNTLIEAGLRDSQDWDLVSSQGGGKYDEG